MPLRQQLRFDPFSPDRIPGEATALQQPLAGVGARFPRAPVDSIIQSIYLTEPGDIRAISPDDIHQGGLGDCFLLSPIGEIALCHPSAIEKMIRSDGNGTQTVTLFEDRSGSLPTVLSSAFKSVQVAITDTFPSDAVNGADSYGQDIFGNRQEIWPQVIEKALAILNGGYDAIAYGGYPTIAMEELTGHSATALSPANLTQSQLRSDGAAGDLITMDTRADWNLPYHLISNHCYMFSGMTGGGSAAMVHLLNPWGAVEPGAIPIAQLGRVMGEIDIGSVT